MESRNHLGIYLRKDRATVVCLASQGREAKLLGCFSVDLEGVEQPSQQELADRIAQACTERGLKAGIATVALDCALFMQHSVHSEFTDHKRIAATVRFDTEEALATDVSEMAVAFRIVSTNEHGADLDVFTAERSVLSDILMSLQSNGIDPVAVLPDAYCLSCYVCESEAAANASGTVYALLSDLRGYFVGAADADHVPLTRAFLVGPSQDRKALLAREALVTTALAGGGAARRLCVLDVGDGFQAQDLGLGIPFEVDDCDLAQMRGLQADELADSANIVDFAIAYGAALPESEKDKGVNLRNDHMPYLGRKVRVQKAVRFLGISLTVLLLAVGVYAQTQLMKIDRYRTTLREKLEPDYLAVMPGVEELPKRMGQAVDKLKRVLRGLEKERGVVDPKSISAKLTLVLRALNDCAAQTDLNIDVITLTTQSITLNGDTSSRSNTLKVFNAMEKAGLTLQKTGYSEKGQRNTFTLAVEPAQQPG